MGVLFTTCSIQVGGLILVPYEYAILGSLHISLYSHLSSISDFVFTCGFIPEILLAAVEMQSSCLATDHDIIFCLAGHGHAEECFLDLLISLLFFSSYGNTR